MIEASLPWYLQPEILRLRAARRAVLDELLADDARRFPPFAMARRCSVLAVEEGPWDSCDPSLVLGLCRLYEQRRGGGRTPSPAALAWLDDTWRGTPAFAALEVYERSRGAT